MNFSVAQVKIELPVSYLLENPEAPGPGVLVLHGYTDHARAARRRLLGKGPFEGLTVFAPNALYPVPLKVGDRYKEAYSWYFRDHVRGEVLVAPELAAQSLLTVMEQLGLRARPWIVAGFSMGGFFAPYLLRAGLDVRAIVAAGAAYLPMSYEGLPAVRLHAVHGMDDTDVPFDKARTSFEALRPRLAAGSFTPVEGLGHSVDEPTSKKIIELIRAEAAQVGASR